MVELDRTVRRGTKICAESGSTSENKWGYNGVRDADLADSGSQGRAGGR